jgi:hypothetical protein
MKPMPVPGIVDSSPHGDTLMIGASSASARPVDLLVTELAVIAFSPGRAALVPPYRSIQERALE